MENSKTYFTIPCSVAKYVIENNLEKCFSVFLYLKNECDGVINTNDISFNKLSEALGIKDKRTIKKYLLKLIGLNWIGYNKRTKNYFLRSTLYVKYLINRKSNHGIKIYTDRLRHLKYQLCAGLIQFKIEGLRRSQNKYIKSKVGSSALKRRGALQMAKELDLRAYFGLSNTQLGKLFNCSKSEANRIKMACEKHGFIKTTKKFKFIASINSTDFHLTKFVNNGNRIRVKKSKEGVIKFYEQLTDEINCFVYCKKMR